MKVRKLSMSILIFPEKQAEEGRRFQFGAKNEKSPLCPQKMPPMVSILSLVFLGKLDLLYVFNLVPDLNSKIRAKKIRF